MPTVILVLVITKSYDDQLSFTFFKPFNTLSSICEL